MAAPIRRAASTAVVSSATCTGSTAFTCRALPRRSSLPHAPSGESDLRPGDLVFFRLAPGSRDVTHVGIYTGQRRFVHAPQTGRNVGEASLDDLYYRERYAGAGRYYQHVGAGLRKGRRRRADDGGATKRSAAPLPTMIGAGKQGWNNMKLRSLLRWLRRSLLSLLLGLLLVGLGFWVHFLVSGPELKPWHPVILDGRIHGALLCRAAR